MGCGKSAVGRALAKFLEVEFIDSDKFIEQRAGLSVSEIFARFGEDDFRSRERNFLENLKENPSPVVISTGGGMPCFADNLELMKNGVIIYLELSIDELFERLKSRQEKRPLLQNLKEAELREFIKKKLNFRKTFYRQADIILSANLPVQTLASQIKQLLRLLPKT